MSLSLRISSRELPSVKKILYLVMRVLAAAAPQREFALSLQRPRWSSSAVAAAAEAELERRAPTILPQAFSSRLQQQ